MSKKKQDKITLNFLDREISGWQQIDIELSVSSMPSRAVLSYTVYQPDTKESLYITEGEECSIAYGKQIILTGYVIQYTETITANSHTIAVNIVSKTVDLTDCSATMVTSDLTIGNNQHNGTTLGDLATRICQPFKILVTVDKKIDNPTIPLFAINLTETPFAILDRLCRQCGVLFYDMPTGGIIITDVHSSDTPAKIAYGHDIEELSITRSTDGRYSEIRAVLQTSNLLTSPPDSIDYVAQVKASEAGKSASDPDIQRYRPLLISVDLGDSNFEVAGKRVQWEVNRRRGRAAPIRVRLTGWTDSDKKLWLPNRPVTITMPGGYDLTLQIETVIFSKSYSGTFSSLTLVTPDSLMPLPIVNKLNTNVAVQALNNNQTKQ